MIVDLPVSHDGIYNVEKVVIHGGDAADVRKVKSQPSSPAVNKRSASLVVSFLTGPLPSLGASLYKVSFSGKEMTNEENDTINSRSRYLATEPLQRKDESKDVEASNGLFSVVFDG